MFKNTKAFSGFSVDDIEIAKQFYGETLGLNISEMKEMGLLNLHLSGGASVLIYPKPNHRPATFTILNFMVEDIEKTVAQLKNMGVVFESYDQKDFKTDGDNIARAGKPHVAWFKDPAGNILSIIQDEKA